MREPLERPISSLPPPVNLIEEREESVFPEHLPNRHARNVGDFRNLVFRHDIGFDYLTHENSKSITRRSLFLLGITPLFGRFSE